MPKLSLVFRKRTFHPGSGVGYHEQTEDEIYYVLSGKGEMTLDGKRGGSHARHGGADADRQLPRPEAGGARDLTVLINYEQAPK